MLGLFRALLERVKALFLTTAALDFEAEFVARHAERQAELLRQADRYEEEGLHGIADHLRRRAEGLELDRPLAGVLPAVAHLQDTPEIKNPAPPRLRLVGGDQPQPTPMPIAHPKKRGGRT